MAWVRGGATCFGRPMTDGEGSVLKTCLQTIIIFAVPFGDTGGVECTFPLRAEEFLVALVKCKQICK